MKFLHLIICISFSEILLAQTPRFSVSPNPNSISFPIDSAVDHNAHGHVKNNTNDTINVYWIREIVQLPQGWVTFVCDANHCFADFVGKCPEAKPNEILANDSTILDVHVQDKGFNGEAHIIMWVYEKEDTSKKVKVDYLFNKIISNNELNNIAIKIYPNPTSHSFHIDYNHGLKRIELHSILGNKVRSYKAIPKTDYDISQLADGLYFVKLIGNDERIFKTIRIQKRSSRP